MQVARCRQAQGMLQQQLPWGVVCQVFTTYDVANALGRIVYHYGELISPQSIGPQQHKVADRVGYVLVLPAQSTVWPVKERIYY